MKFISVVLSLALATLAIAKRSSDSESTDSWESSSSRTDKHVHKYCKKRGQLAMTFLETKLGKPMAQISKVLFNSEIEALFFVNGRDFSKKVSKRRYMQNKKALAYILSKGHVIGITPWENKSQWKKNSSKRVLRSVQRSAYHITRVLGYRPNFVHPPKGTVPKSAVRILTKHGYHIIGWNTTLQKNGTELPKYKHKGSAKKHSFISYQHGDKPTAKSLRKTIKNIEKRDYDFVSVQKCVDLRPYAMVRKTTSPAS